MFGASTWNDHTFALFVSALTTAGVAWVIGTAAFLVERRGKKILLGLVAAWLGLAATMTGAVAIGRSHRANGSDGTGEPLAGVSADAPPRALPVMAVPGRPEPALLYVPIEPVRAQSPEPAAVRKPDPEPAPEILPRAPLRPIEVELLPPEPE